MSHGTLSGLVVAALFFSAGAVAADDVAVFDPADVLSSGNYGPPETLVTGPSITSGGSLAGQASHVSGNPDNYLPISSNPGAATILMGTNTGSPTTVQWGWRGPHVRRAPGGGHFAPPYLPLPVGYLASDVVDLEGLASAAFTLQMEYTLSDTDEPYEALQAAAGEIYLASLTGTTLAAQDTWENATAERLFFSQRRRPILPEQFPGSVLFFFGTPYGRNTRMPNSSTCWAVGGWTSRRTPPGPSWTTMASSPRPPSPPHSSSRA